MKKSKIAPKPNTRNIIVEYLASLLIILFVHSAISNYLQLGTLKTLMNFYGVNPSVAAWSLFLAEALIAVLLFIPITRTIGLVSVLATSIFANYVVITTPHLPHDFGGILNLLSYAHQIILFSLLSVVSVTALWLSFTKSNKVDHSEQEAVVFT